MEGQDRPSSILAFSVLEERALVRCADVVHFELSEYVVPKHFAPALGWKPNTEGAVDGYPS